MGDCTQQARLQVECMATTVWVEILSWIASSLAVLLVRQRASTSWAQMVSSSFARHQKASKSWSHELIGDRVMNSHEVVMCIARQYVARLLNRANLFLRVLCVCQFFSRDRSVVRDEKK